MEKERRKLDKQLDCALEKTKAANHGQEVLEAKIKVKYTQHHASSVTTCREQIQYAPTKK